MLVFYRDTRHWRAPVDHNHLRITRIIRSLRLLVSDAAAGDAGRVVIAPGQTGWGLKIDLEGRGAVGHQAASSC